MTTKKYLILLLVLVVVTMKLHAQQEKKVQTSFIFPISTEGINLDEFISK